MTHIAIWLLTSTVALYVTAVITGALFSLFSKDKDKEGAVIFGYIVSPFILVAVLMLNAFWRL